MIADTTFIDYPVTLLTIGTVVALLTVWLARRDRVEQRDEQYRQRFAQSFDRLSDALVELVEAAERTHIGDRSPEFRVARMKLQVAVDGCLAPSQIPKTRKLRAAQAERVLADADEALDEIFEASRKAHLAVRWVHSERRWVNRTRRRLGNWRIQRVLRKKREWLDRERDARSDVT